MRLVDKTTGREIKEGDVVQSRRYGECHLSGLDPNKQVIFLFSDRGEGNATYSSPSDIGAKFDA